LGGKMIKLFESLLGIVFLIAAIQFIFNPKEAIKSMNSALYRKNPKIINGHLTLTERYNYKNSNSK
jgi:hypothetical protein